MAKSIRKSTVKICFAAAICIFQFETVLTAPSHKSSSAINLISHLDSETGIVFEDKCKPTCSSSKTIDYVCGTDGKSYKNIDELECSRKACHQDLKVKSQGKCPDQNTNKDSFREKKLYMPVLSPSKATICNPDECGCSNEFLAICGSDGVTYGNRCLLRCNRKCNPEVTEFHDGYCGRIFFKDSLAKTFQVSSNRQQPIEYTSLLL